MGRSMLLIATLLKFQKQSVIFLVRCNIVKYRLSRRVFFNKSNMFLQEGYEPLLSYSVELGLIYSVWFEQIDSLRSNNC